MFVLQRHAFHDTTYSCMTSCRADEMVHEFEKIRVLIKSNGQVHWEPGGVFATTCDIDILYFPFDTQVSISVCSHLQSCRSYGCRQFLCAARILP